MQIAYLHRLTFEETEKRFREEAKELGAELTMIKYRQLKLVGDSIFFGGKNLVDFDLWYFRAVGSELEWAELLKLYAKKNEIPVVDEYLLNEGPLQRFKSVMGVRLNSAAVPYPKTSMVESFADLNEELKKWPLPVIVKLSQGGRHGMGTFFIKTISDLEELHKKLEERKNLAKEENKKPLAYRGFLIQEYIPNDGDFRVITVGYQCIGGFKRQPKDESLVMNKSLGKSEKLDKIPEDVIEIAEKAAKVLQVEVAGIDLAKDSRTGKIYIIEVNEAPQFKAFEKRTGINAAGKILEYLCRKAK